METTLIQSTVMGIILKKRKLRENFFKDGFAHDALDC